MKLCRSLFRMVDTHGLPLSVILEELRKRAAAMDVPDFIADARRAGWKDSKIEAMLREAWQDVHGPIPAELDARLVRECRP